MKLRILVTLFSLALFLTAFPTMAADAPEVEGPDPSGLNGETPPATAEEVEGEEVDDPVLPEQPVDPIPAAGNACLCTCSCPGAAPIRRCLSSATVPSCSVYNGTPCTLPGGVFCATQPTYSGCTYNPAACPC